MTDVYSDVRVQLSEGSLPLTIKVDGLFLKLGSPNSEDFRWAEEVSPRLGWRQDFALVAKCVHSINGRVLSVEDKFDTLTVLMGTSKPLKRLLHTNLIHLISRSRKAFEYLEAFCYESESRVLWRIWKAQKDFGISPVQGQIVFSDLQIAWVLWNTSEDDRIAQKEQWDRALFQASAMNSHVNKIRTKWDAAEQDEEDYRERVRTHARAGKPLSAQDPKARRKSRVKTEADLREEMRKWVAGEEDEHDRAIREYKETMKRRLRETEERAQRMREAAIQRRRDLSDTSLISQPIVGLSEEQVARLKSNKKYVETDETSERNDYVMNRYVLSGVQAGKLSVNEQGEIVAKSKSLMDQVKQRNPTLED